MNKKIIIGLVLVIVIAIVGVGGYLLLNNSDNKKETEKSSSNNSGVNENSNTYNDRQDNKTNNDDTTTTSNGKILVVYYSATGSTKNVAERIAVNLNADLFEIEPVDEYTSNDLNWNDSDSRVSKEHADESLRNVELKTTTVDNWKEYDTILIGYPIWWGIAAWPTNTFVIANDFTGKTVIPFCTSSSSGIGESGKLLAKETNSGNWQEGYRFNSNPSDADIKTFTDSIM